MRALKITLIALAFIALHAHAKDNRGLAVTHGGSAGKRVALVIGNGNYKHTDILKKLPNPTHDAEDIAKALRGFGFEVIEKKDQSQESMREAIAEFSRKITDSDAALFYYAGHGLQVKGKNYLVPVDAKIETEAQAGSRSIDVSEILEEMDNAKSKVNIVMLDACRSNDFSGKFRSGGTRGLAAPSSQPKGTVIVYATDPGNVAADGSGRNGLFTAGLLTAFKGGDLSLRGVLVRASKEVERGSEKKQTPYINGPATLQEEFRFAPGTQIASLESVHAPTQPAARIKTTEQIEDEYWEEIKDSSDLSGFEQYRKVYPEGRYFNTANLKIAKLKKETAQASNDTKVGQTFHDCAECPEMVVIPAGSFDMGSPSYEAGRFDNEGPVHRINVSAFAVGKTEITRGQFAAFVRETSYNTGDKCWTIEGGKIEERSGRSWRDPSYRQDDSHPVICVNWNDAKAYTEWLSRKTGKQYRLPTEAEWEYAARGNSNTARYWGDSPDQACGYENVLEATAKVQVVPNAPSVHNCSDGYIYTAPVGSFKLNPFGLNDMLGNVQEWVGDCGNQSYNNAPTDGSAQHGGDCVQHMVRGGSWVSMPRYLRSAYRDISSFRVNYYGFRLVRMLP